MVMHGTVSEGPSADAIAFVDREATQQNAPLRGIDRSRSD